MVLKNFADERTKNIYEGDYTHGVRIAMSNNTMKEAQRMLDILNIVPDLKTLITIPSLRSDGGVRDCHGEHSMPIDEQWRIVFRWNGKYAEDVQVK